MIVVIGRDGRYATPRTLSDNLEGLKDSVIIYRAPSCGTVA